MVLLALESNTQLILPFVETTFFHHEETKVCTEGTNQIPWAFLVFFVLFVVESGFGQAATTPFTRPVHAADRPP
jgi:hypothetical protein